MEEISVYLFLGFLEAGKTRFIQETLEDPRFNSGERTLLLLCEEGEAEYDPTTFAADAVQVELVEAEAQLTPDYLEKLVEKTGAQRVLVEYNGMWMLDSLLNAMPGNWVIYQTMLFADANTFSQYDRNMRSLVGDKLKPAEVVVFNRMRRDMDKMPLHQIVRSVTRKAMIVYEYPDGTTEEDTIVDPLPFDIDAPVVEIGDDAYAHWYRDMMEEPGKYPGKTVRFTGLVVLSDKLPKGFVIIGRHVMTCCEADISFCGMLCRWKGRLPSGGGWAVLTATISMEYSPVYKREGPVLTMQSAKPAKAPNPKVATFY